MKKLKNKHLILVSALLIVTGAFFKVMFESSFSIVFFILGLLGVFYLIFRLITKRSPK